ncbi:MAG: elongation factor P hydroxylase [Halioglobus sp.]
MSDTQALILEPTHELSSIRLEQVFANCFLAEFNTRLIGGYEEPLYQPETHAGNTALIQYRSDYFASALHEVAHWCIAGPARRLQVDYGYWYAPDGRDADTQRQFELAEYKPQAMEWFFAKACSSTFKLSLDNLSGNNIRATDTQRFSQAVLEQAHRWLASGLPPRGQRFFIALQQEFSCGQSTLPQKVLEFSAGELR